MAAALFGSPSHRNNASAVFRTAANACGALALRTWQRSSPWVTSRTQCSRFSIP